MKRRLLVLCFILMIGTMSACQTTADSSYNSPTVSTLPSPTTTTKESITPSLTPSGEQKEPLGYHTIEVPENLFIPKEQYPRVDGSTATLPLSQAVYQCLTGATAEEAEANIKHYKTTNSYLRLIDGEVDLLIVGTPNNKVFDYIEETGVELYMEPIAIDAFIFMVNENNPVTSLTSEQIVDIYSGKIKNWSEVGGEDKEIIAFQRNENAGSQTLMEQLVMKGIPMADAPSMKIETMSGTLDAIAEYNNDSNAIGYSVYYYASEMYAQPGIRFMDVNGITPNHNTIRSGEYPFQSTRYAVVRKDADINSAEFQIFRWLTTGKSQKLIESLGYVAVDESKLGTDGSSNTLDNEQAGAYTLPLKEDERLFISLRSPYSDEFTNSGTILAMDRSLTITDYITNISDHNIIADIYPADQMMAFPVITYSKDGESTIRYGLYDFKTNDWFLKPSYPYLKLLDSKTYLMQLKEDKILYQIMDISGKLLAELNQLIPIIGTILFPYENTNFTYLDQEQLQIAVNLPKDGISEPTKLNDSFYVRNESAASNNIAQIYNAVYRISDDSLCFNMNSFLDLRPELKSNSTQEDVFEIVHCLEGKQHFLVYYNEQYYLTDISGAIIKEFIGDWHFINHLSLFQITENGTMENYNLENGQLFKTILDDYKKLNYYNYNGNYLVLNYLSEDGTTQEVLYFRDQLITKAPYISIHPMNSNENCTLLSINEEMILYSSEGTELYRSFQPDDVCLFANNHFMVIKRGNYILVQGYDGTCYYKLIDTYYSD